MSYSRFFNQGRNIFGTRLLEMSANNIRRLCSSPKFHSSTRLHEMRVQVFDSLINNTTVNASGIQLEGLSEICNESKDLFETLRSLGLNTSTLKDVLANEGCKAVNLRCSRIATVEMLKQSQPRLDKINALV